MYSIILHRAKHEFVLVSGIETRDKAQASLQEVVSLMARKDDVIFIIREK